MRLGKFCVVLAFIVEILLGIPVTSNAQLGPPPIVQLNNYGAVGFPACQPMSCVDVLGYYVVVLDSSNSNLVAFSSWDVSEFAPGVNGTTLLPLGPLQDQLGDPDSGVRVYVWVVHEQYDELVHYSHVFYLP